MPTEGHKLLHFVRKCLKASGYISYRWGFNHDKRQLRPVVCHSMQPCVKATDTDEQFWRFGEQQRVKTGRGGWLKDTTEKHSWSSQQTAGLSRCHHDSNGCKWRARYKLITRVLNSLSSKMMGFFEIVGLPWYAVWDFQQSVRTQVLEFLRVGTPQCIQFDYGLENELEENWISATGILNWIIHLPATTSNWGCKLF